VAQKDAEVTLREALYADRRDLEATRRELEMRMESVECRMRRAIDENAKTCSDRVIPLTFDRSASSTVFHRQIETAADHNDWKTREKSTHLLTVSQGQIEDVVHSVPAAVTCEDTVREAAKSDESPHGITVNTTPERRRNSRPVCWRCLKADILNRNCRRRTDGKVDHDSGNAGIITLYLPFHTQRVIQGKL
jgi:hypothetical protein